MQIICKHTCSIVFKCINFCRCVNKVIGTLDLKLKYSQDPVSLLTQNNTNSGPEQKIENTDLEVNIKIRCEIHNFHYIIFCRILFIQHW
jgi:hypothetical protein